MEQTEAPPRPCDRLAGKCECCQEGPQCRTCPVLRVAPAEPFHDDLDEE